MKQFIILLLTIFSLTAFAQEQKSTRKERNYIVEGNKLYANKEYKKAEEAYNRALKENPMSYRAMYNKALTQIRIGEDEDLKDQEQKKQYLQNGVQTMESVASINGADPEVSSMAHYNLGNIAFKTGDYASAVQSYKQSLRLDPTSDKARKNLRIAQKKLQQQNNQNQNNQDQQQEDQQQNQDKQDQQQKQDKQEEQQPKPQSNKQQEQQQPQDGEMSEQSAEQILNAMENKENSTRQRVQGQLNKGNKNSGRNRPIKKW